LRGLIFAGGDYDETLDYRRLAAEAEVIVGADSGGESARRCGVRLHYLVGDMDSISPECLAWYEAQAVTIRRYPAAKDQTDTQLALQLLEELGVREIILLGTVGSRYDHSLANLFSSIAPVRRGIRLTHLAPRLKIFVIRDEVELNRAAGPIISLLPLTATVDGVTTEGLVYPLREATLRGDEPYAVSNGFVSEQARITVAQGILAVLQVRE
jgi:thiamine pyrophosphokinase